MAGCLSVRGESDYHLYILWSALEVRGHERCYVNVMYNVHTVHNLDKEWPVWDWGTNMFKSKWDRGTIPCSYPGLQWNILFFLSPSLLTSHPILTRETAAVPVPSGWTLPHHPWGFTPFRSFAFRMKANYIFSLNHWVQCRSIEGGTHSLCLHIKIQGSLDPHHFLSFSAVTWNLTGQIKSDRAASGLEGDQASNSLNIYSCIVQYKQM